MLVAARSRPSSRLRTSRSSPSSGRRAATKSNTPRRARISRAIPTLRSSSGCASSSTMATGTRVFRTPTARRGRVRWALLRRRPGTRGAIRTTRRWRATQLCDTATSNQPSIEPGDHQATEAARKWFPHTPSCAVAALRGQQLHLHHRERRAARGARDRPRAGSRARAAARQRGELLAR